MLDMKKWIAKVTQKLASLATVATSGSYNDLTNKPVDHITAEGASGNWRYRKWKSGKIEAWGYQSYSSIAINISSGAYGGYRSDTVTMSIPSGIFTKTPNYAFLQKKTAQAGSIYYAQANSATNIAMMFGGSTSSQTITSQTILAYVVQV